MLRRSPQLEEQEGTCHHCRSSRVFVYLLSVPGARHSHGMYIEIVSCEQRLLERRVWKRVEMARMRFRMVTVRRVFFNTLH